MLRVFFHSENEIKKANEVECFHEIPLEKILWVDLQFPTDAEKKKYKMFLILTLSS